jgi:hypothetical protein
MRAITSRRLRRTVDVAHMPEMINFVRNYSGDTTQKQTTSQDLVRYRKIILKNVLRKYVC